MAGVGVAYSVALFSYFKGGSKATLPNSTSVAPPTHSATMATLHRMPAGISVRAGPRAAPRLVAPRAAAIRTPLCARPMVASSPVAAQRASPAMPALPSRARTVRVAAQSAASPAPTAPAFKWGANMKDLGISVGIATLLWFIPPPAGVSMKAWQLLSVFVGTIVGIITTPLPLGAVAVLGLGAAMITKVLTFAEAFSAFASEIP